MRHVWTVLMLLAVAGTMVIPAWAEDLCIGKIKKVDGHAVVVREEDTIPVTAGMSLYKNDILETREDGSMGILFNDNSMMSMGENSRMVVTDYVFEPEKNRLGFFVDIFKGTVTYLTGMIGKMNPDRVKFHTPSATVGIRGTHLAIKVEE